MKNILQIIKDAGVELADEQSKAVEAGVKENYRTLADYDKQTKKVTDLTADRDQYKSQYETAAETLKGLEGKDFDAITRERDEWKAKADKADADYQAKLAEAEAAYNRQIEERDFNDVLAKKLSAEKFTSDFAREGIMKLIREKGLKREGDTILGLDDYMKTLKESQKDAFATGATPPPKYSTPAGSAGEGGEPGGTGHFTVPKIW